MASGNGKLIDQLKLVRSSAEAHVSQKVNKLNELMAECENIEALNEVREELQQVLQEFQVAHKAYHGLIKTESEQEESSRYYNSVLEIVSELEQEITSWLNKPALQTSVTPINVRPRDSVSTVGSHVSFHTRSVASSSASSKVKAAARKAALEARAAALQNLHELQIEEMRLQQRKAQIELEAEIAEAEAERKAYEENEAIEHREISSRLKERDLNDHSPQLTPQAKIASTPRVGSTTGNPTPKQTFPAATLSREHLNKHIDEPLSLKRSLNPRSHEWYPTTSPVQQHVSLDYNRANSLQDESFQRLIENHERQNQAIQQLIQQQQQGVLALTLPQPSLQVFSGDPIDYCDFVRAFEHIIERKTLRSSARLYYLVQYTSGAVQELMRSCLSIREEEGYTEARRLLQERYGQNYKIAAAHVKRLVDGPTIRTDDGPALQQFSIQLTSCVNTLKEIRYLNKLDNPDNLKKIIDRLPYAMRVKWRDTVDHIVEREARDVTVADIMKFVTAKARAASHPIFGNVSSEGKTKQLPSKQRTRGPKADTFSSLGKQEDSQSANKKPECPLCGADHLLPRCDKFRKQSLEERQKLIRERQLCSNCLFPGHFVRSCQKESFCRVRGCTSKHSTFLHPNSNKNSSKNSGENSASSNRASNSEPKPNNNANPAASNGYAKLSFSASTTVTGLAILPVCVRAKDGKDAIQTYAFLDSGSNTSFCTETLLQKLNIKGKKTNLSLTTLQGENEPIECSMISLLVSDLHQENSFEIPMVYSRPSLPVSRETIAMQEHVNRWPHLKGVTIPQIEAEIGLLIGSDVPQLLQPQEIRKSENGGPFATKTVLGWVLNGPLGRDTPNSPTVNFSIQASKSLEEQFRDYCNQEFNDSNLNPKASMSLNDRRALDIMEETLQLKNGHYEIALPWKTYPPNLVNNRSVAERRLSLLKKRLKREPLVHKKYRDFMDDLLKKDYARKVKCQDIGPLGTHWYLSHHPVFHPKKPDKVRVVFDCSAKHLGTSLNDQLLQGPDLTNSLVGVLSRFREEQIALMADVEAMFHQVRVRPSDCDALRFLWWPDGNLVNEPQEYQMRVHLFGGASSPSCANFALKKTAQDNKTEFDLETIETVERNFYVDDCLKSVSSEELAVNLSSQLCELLARGGFKLTKWLSNSRKVIESLPASERAAQVKDLDFEKLPVERALGVQWNISSDQFGFRIVIKDRPATRRGILSIVSSVYDPLGFVAPFILNAKLILQDLCRKKLDWDDVIPEDIMRRWQAWLQELPKLEQVAIDRCFKPPNFGEVSSTQLHHFSDASQQGYGAVTYLRITDHRPQW